jgi:N6-adenosine-specific RNA methylase IME4
VNSAPSQTACNPADDHHCRTAGEFAQPTIVRSLDALVEGGAKFSAIYADPPWPYTNTAARGAAENHYRTLSLERIRNEPVKQLVADQAHLHLWTTNAFLREAFDVIRAWGFRYKSCLVWIKPQIGMGNYWRVSHEFLLLGVRGNLPFRSRTCRSWLMTHRTIHSRKPFAFRELVERVSPGPYLELYGREEQPNTGWTVYGNAVERRLF